MPKATSHHNGKSAHKTNESKVAPAESNGNAIASKRKVGKAVNVGPLAVDELEAADAGVEGGLTAAPRELDLAALDDLDLTERFDLGETLGRPAPARPNESIVEELDEIYDKLALDDKQAEEKPAKAERDDPTRRNSYTLLTVEEIETTTEEIEILEVETLHIAPEHEQVEESEPDAAEIARAATEVVEVEDTEDLERAVDHALSMEGVSVDDPVRIYLREIGRTALLKSPDESALAERIAAGRKAAMDLDALEKGLPEGSSPADEHHDERLALIARIADGAQAKQTLVQANLRLVVSIARRYIGRGLSLLDLIQEGNIGLMRAADKFDYQKGYKFSTYATWWIRQAITRAISDQSRTIRLPVHITEMVTRLRRAAHELQQTLLREPTEEELGQALNMPAERVRKVLDMARHPASLDAPMEDGEDNFLGDFIEDERTGGPEEEASRQMLKEQVDDILRKLTERERQILQMRYGLTDDRPRTLEEVAKEFGITRERIRQIETRILRKLRYARYGASKLRGYLD